jgi:hypothetical protein
MTSGALTPTKTNIGPLVALPIVLLLWVLPFHSLTVAFFFGVLRIGMHATTILAAWKEGVVVLLFAAVLLRTTLTRGPRVAIAAPDVAITGLIALALIFALVEAPIFGANVPAKVAIFGIRSSVFFMVLYYVGRGVPDLAARATYIKHLFWVAVVVAAIGVLERIFVTPQMLVALGAASYLSDFLGLTATTGENVFGLPANYFSVLGRVPVRRAGSVFLGGQAFAIPFLLLMPAATAWVFDPSRRLRLWATVGYAIVWAGLLVTITRTTILVCALQVVVYFLMTRKPSRVVATGLVAFAVLLAAMVVVPGLGTFVVRTLTFQTSSSYSHVFDWRRGLVAFADAPWGHGLGSSDMTAVRFGRVALTADNVFLNYAVDLGILGLICFLAILFTIGLFSWRLFRTSPDSEIRIVAATVFLANLGIALNGTSSAPFNAVFLAYNFFLLAGAAVSVLQRTAGKAEAG